MLCANATIPAKPFLMGKMFWRLRTRLCDCSQIDWNAVSFGKFEQVYVAVSWYPVSQSKQAGIRPDMTKVQVSDLVGRPTPILDQQHWQYSRNYWLMTIEINFASDGHFARRHLELE